VNRDFVEYEVPGSTQHAKVHQVTAETEGTFNTVNGPVDVREGQYVVKGQNESFHDVYDSNVFDELGWSATREQRDLVGEVEPKRADTRETVVERDDDFFEPSEHTAKEVHAFLHDDSVSDENKDRVRQAEEEGSNRASALR
jgi:hypothetical protein